MLICIAVCINKTNQSKDNKIIPCSNSSGNSNIRQDVVNNIYETCPKTTVLRVDNPMYDSGSNSSGSGSDISIRLNTESANQHATHINETYDYSENCNQNRLHNNQVYGSIESS